MTGKTIYSVVASIFFILCLEGNVIGAEIEFSSVVNPTSLSVDDYITVTVSVTGPDASSAGVPVLEANPDFSITDTSTSTQINMINFKTSVTKSYTFSLKPRKTGTFNVGAATVRVGKQTFTAPATKVEVFAGSVPQPHSPQSESKNGTERAQNSGGGNSDIFIKTFVDNKEPYTGEQIILTFELYNRLTLIGDTEYNAPSTTGFWSADLPKIPSSTKIVGNSIYQYNTLKTALFPTTSGELTIGKASLSYHYGGFFSPIQSRTISTEPITIRVKPLPEQGKPDGFRGAVGSFSISASADKKSVKLGDVVTIKVTVTGKGNLDLITLLDTPSFSAFKTYDPKVSETITNSGFIVGGTKTWDYVVIPKYQGNIIIDRFSLTFFDPSDKSYHTVSTEPVELIVLPGDASAFSGSTKDISRKVIENIANDIHYIKPDKNILKSTQRQVYSHMVFYLIYILPSMIFTAAFLYKRRRDTIERNTGLKRRLNAWKNAQKGLAEAFDMVDSGKIREFCGKLSDISIGYIGDRLNLDASTITISSLENILKNNGVSPDLAERIRKTLELCDFVRFSSDGTGNDIQQKLLNETQKIITTLKESL